MRTVKVGKKTVGDGHPCYVIAEVGSNHNRNLDTALHLIDIAADAGCDAIKFQTYSGKTLYSTKTPQFDYLAPLSNRKPHELLEDISLPREWQPLLAEHCRTKDIEFLSTPFDAKAVDELDAINVAAFKVASFEIVDLPLINYIGSKLKPIILSTGMATLAEIEEAMDSAREGGSTDFCLLQCASVYPAPPSIMNLSAMATMKEGFKVPVGLSDHTLGTHITVSAVAMGANLVEKHFTLDREMQGPDHSFAIEPNELKEMVSQIRDVESAIGDGLKRGPSDQEAKEMYAKARRSIVSARRIRKGDVITEDMLTIKRPGFGIKPKFIKTLIGRVASVDIEEDDIITWEML